ncbi:hypothetical protein SLEP1_g15176 [Rubroshorea leprosula]|uniref:Uncharacterized protein n=1 Tax=Rubroshorea leprosula TaxID=152421 RepID=A0AAV5ISL3_9ROSI|nr:hypothetical protein SLEP1_g15176 [Rubroshorea leprosula]
MSSFGITSMAIMAIYYRVSSKWRVERELLLEIEDLE